MMVSHRILFQIQNLYLHNFIFVTYLCCFDILGQQDEDKEPKVTSKNFCCFSYGCNWESISIGPKSDHRLALSVPPSLLVVTDVRLD